MTRFNVFASVAIGLSGLLPARAAFAQMALSTGGDCPAEFMKQAQQLIDQHREQTKAPGIAVAFDDNGKTCFFTSGTDGRARATNVTPDTMFATGSVEKVINATLLATSLAQGRGSIEDPAAKYIVGQGNRRVRAQSPFWKVTLRDLVTHTSALPNSPPNSKRIGEQLFHDQPMPGSLIQYLDTWQPEYAPGTRYRYSNLGFVLVGRVAVSLGGNGPYTTLLANGVTGPLGMTRTGMFCGAPNPACAVAHNDRGLPVRHLPVGLRTTARDMLRFVRANLGDIQVPPNLAKAIALTHQELFRMTPDHAIGMGWEKWHSGPRLLLAKDGEDSGFQCWVGVMPNRHHAVVLFRNGGGKTPLVKLGKHLLGLATKLQS